MTGCFHYRLLGVALCGAMGGSILASAASVKAQGLVSERRSFAGIVGFVARSAELDHLYSTKAITRTKYLRKRGQLGRSAAKWISGLFSSKTQNADGTHALVTEFFEDRSHEDEIAKQIFGQADTRSDRFMRALSWLQIHLTRLPRTISYEDFQRDVDKFGKASLNLDEELRLGKLSLIDHRHAKQVLRRRVTSWLAKAVPYVNGLEIARKYIYEGEGNHELVTALRPETHRVPSEEWLLQLEGLREKLFVEKLTVPNKSYLFPFKFQKKNLVRGFVPRGYRAIDVMGQADFMSSLIGHTNVSNLDILSVFTEKSPRETEGEQVDAKAEPMPVFGKNVFVAFRELASTEGKSGVAYFANGVLTHVKVFDYLSKK